MSIGAGPDVGLRLRKAFSHFVFIEEELDADSFRSAADERGETGSDGFPRNSSFCKDKKKFILSQISNLFHTVALN